MPPRECREAAKCNLSPARRQPRSKFHRGRAAVANSRGGIPVSLPRKLLSPYSSSCQGVRIRGPSAVTAIVNSKWAASVPSCE